MTNFGWVEHLTNDWHPLRLQPIGSSWAIAATISLCTISPAAAETTPVNPRLVPETASAWSDRVTSVATLATESADVPAPQAMTDAAQAASPEKSSEKSSEKSLEASLVVAGADNVNPGLQLPPPKPEAFRLERLVTDYRNDRDNFKQHNRWMEQTAQFRLQNGDFVRFKTGFNVFEQQKAEAVSNVPLQVSWDHKLGNFNLHAAAGVDVFDRLPTVPNFALEVALPIFPSVTLTAVVEQGAYKSNAQTLGNRIAAFRYGASLYWQLDKTTSLFASYRRGDYSDDNREEQSFSRLERKLGQFSIAANLFTWRFAQNAESRKGYYSPPDFLLYSGEVAWQGDVFQFLRCRLSAAFGRQRVNAAFTGGNTYQALCTAKVAPNIEADMGYTFSNAQNRSGGGNAYESQTVIGQLRVTF